MRKELFKKIRHIDIRLRRKAQSLFSGSYRSALKGQGLAFSDFREYIPGDDIKAISWSLTAKVSKPYIKTFEEEKTATIVLALDISSSMGFSALGANSKREAVELLSGLLAFCAQKNGDFIGLLLFSDKKELYIPPAKGNRQAFRLLREICAFKGEGNKTDIGAGIDFLSRVLKKNSSVFIFSDFLTEKNFENPLKRLAKKHEANCLIFSHPVERKAPPLGLLEIEDIETGKQKLVDFSSPTFQKQFAKQAQKRAHKRDRQIIRSGSGKIFIDLGQDIYQPLVAFFNKKARKFYS